MVNKVIYIVCNILAEILLIFCGAFFAATETAYTSLSKITVRQMLKSKKKNAKLISKLRSNLDGLISTVLIGTNFITTLSSSIATAFSTEIFGSQYVSYATAILSILVIIFVEIVPKTYASCRTEKTAIGSAKIINAIQIIIFPIVWIFAQITKLIELLEKLFIKKEKSLITEEEFKTLLEVGEKEGTLEVDERKMLDRIFEFSDLHVHEIMRHRSFVKYLNINSSFDDVIEFFKNTSYSKIPVYENEPENIVGVLNYKSVIFASSSLSSSKDFIRICMDEVLFVPESFSALEMLQKFKQEKNNFAVVVNEYGSMAGIITMDDILREVFDNIAGEYGETELAPEQRITVVKANEFLIPGDMKLDDVNEVLNLNLDSENFETLGGWLLERFDELPQVGAVYKKDNIVFIVDDQSSRRIQSVRVKFV